MKNLKLTIEYDGTNFFGWQYQPGKRTIQGEIENAIKKITQENIRIIGACRTDRGVHALGQVVNFKTATTLSLEKLRKGMNALICEEIYIKEIVEVPIDFHARFSAKGKIYAYKLILQPSPLKRKLCWYVGHQLNFESMENTLQYFIGQHDFKNISVSNEKENTICTIEKISLTKTDFEIIIDIKADRFLRRMVRGIVGFLVDVGRGRFSESDAGRLLNSGLNGLYFAPPHGLYLMEVIY